ncbi:hypothetical protein AaE_014664 [Aphanomyces astaci]|uniref:Transposase Tc1-like domain-containing protein n=1 Tax=Aphanomyces astaci TaxID=112090 RepID=A0A6A4YZ63_APHAT|nr:hypothetical protein AaE_014664 [Aphanomyces astaci]
MPRSSVKTIIKAFKSTGLLHAAPRSGRPRVTTEHEDRIIVRAVKQNRRLSAETLQETFAIFHDKDISRTTIRNRITAAGLNGRAARKKPFLSKLNRKKRLAFAKKYQTWTPEEWEKVLFTDESPFNLTGSCGRVYVWRKPGEEFLDACVVPTFKSGRQTVMVWGAIGFNGTGTLLVIDGRMTSADYLELLEDQLPDNFAKLGLPLDFVFQQDNAPIHKANIVMGFLDENAIQTLDHLWLQ